MIETVCKTPLIFELTSGLLEDRIDPHYYRPDYIEAANALSKSPFEIKKLQEISKSIQNFGAYALYNKIKYVEEGIPFLREGNIKEDEIDITNVKYITAEHHELLKKSKVKPGSVLVTMTGNPGIATFVPKSAGESNSNQHIAKIVLKEGINPEYVSAFINSKFGKCQTERMTTGTTHQHIFLYSIGSFRIPVPPKDVQEKVVQTLRTAREAQKQNIKKSKEMLESIECFVLKKLGIPRIKVIDEELVTIPGEKIEDRLDVEYYKKSYIANVEAVRDSKFELKTLKEISVEIDRGVEPGSKAYKDEGIPFLRIQNILPYTLDFTDTVYIDEKLYQNLSKHQIFPNDVLFSKDATIGISLVVPDNIRKCVISSGIARVKLKKGMNPLFVSSFLNTSTTKLEAHRRSYGSIIRHLSMKQLMSLKIPVPSRPIQDSIAQAVARFINEAKELEINAEKLIINAKSEIERIIMGLD